VADDSLYLMSPMEVVLGSVLGWEGTLPPPTRSIENPRRVLEDVVREALLRPPCGVAFSGGRDSSVVLAVAAHVARREGLPEPVPVTRVFPGVVEAEESSWQELVVRHLGLADWHRIVIFDDLDFVGPIAAEHLVQHGIVWPPAIGADVPLVKAVEGGSILDGEGGDDMLGDSMHRIAPLSRLRRSPRPLRWDRIRRALGALAPAPVRTRHIRQRAADEPRLWLRPSARDAMLDAFAETEGGRPLSFAASVRVFPRLRAQLLAARNRRILAGRRAVDLSSPFLDADFVHAMARHGKVFGPGDRTGVLRLLVPDLLPDDLLTRVSKARFNTCYMARHTREFAESWEGDGLDPALVDWAELRGEWLSEWPHPATSALLQAAWLATTAGAVASRLAPAAPTCAPFRGVQHCPDRGRADPRRV
jgi:asparagine synthase (glutamine-hydrolysing)